ncbi:hypothetical protein [Acidovorax sp. SUPP2539]|uniref:hypothetical protein n=1 Tax=Acidovorax sp. SUPP2539 TaxID=2920878 RepID=UPI0023DE5A3B|nr:hypothetical protein [Acidovorax sp. SUPP2539]GKS91799.1 hypothetical protein AVTE2539_20560 [Acidovorax sp. SUPP2539]
MPTRNNSAHKAFISKKPPYAIKPQPYDSILIYFSQPSINPLVKQKVIKKSRDAAKIKEKEQPPEWFLKKTKTKGQTSTSNKRDPRYILILYKNSMESIPIIKNKRNSQKDKQRSHNHGLQIRCPNIALNASQPVGVAREVTRI